MAARIPPPDFGPPSTLSLDPERIVWTISQLSHRIDERFPASGLGRLCRSLLEVGEQTKARLDAIQRPVWWLRVATWLMAALVLGGAVAAVRAVWLEIPAGFGSAFDAIQVLESGIQDVIFIAILLVFLITAEDRVQRRAALRYIRELRAMAHIVDMHQLTKGPRSAAAGSGGYRVFAGTHAHARRTGPIPGLLLRTPLAHLPSWPRSMPSASTTPSCCRPSTRWRRSRVD